MTMVFLREQNEQRMGELEPIVVERPQLDSITNSELPPTDGPSGTMSANGASCGARNSSARSMISKKDSLGLSC